MHPYLLETFAHDRAAAITRSAGVRSKRQPGSSAARGSGSAGCWSPLACA